MAKNKHDTPPTSDDPATEPLDPPATITVFAAPDEPSPVPPPPAARPVERVKMLRVQDGELYAVELEDGWIPNRAIGPLTDAQATGSLDALDWGASFDARTWNAARLVRVNDKALERIVSGRHRISKGMNSRRRAQLRDRGLASRPDFGQLHDEARRALDDATAR